MTRASILAMTGRKIPREVSYARTNGECGDILELVVSRAKACTASPDDNSVHPFGYIDGRDGGSTIELARED